MIDYIPHIHNQNDKKEIPSILMEFIKNLAGFFISYKKKTRHVYPKTQVSDIFIDQKSLKLIVSYHPLLYDAVGLSG
jgi:predicted transcriptional regulator